MPLPEPHDGESEKSFVSRCIGSTALVSEFPDISQRAAVCYRQHRSKRNGGSSVEKAAGALGMHIVGPANPARELDVRDATGDSEQAAWLSARDHLVSLAKRTGRSIAEIGPDERRRWTDEEGIDVEEETALRKRRSEIRKRAAVRKDAIGDDGARRAPQTTGTDQDVDSRVHDFVDDILEPPYPLDIIASLHENSGALRRNVEAMATNVDGFGYRFEPVLDFSHPSVANHVRDLMLQQAVGDTPLADLTPESLASLEPTPDVVDKQKKFWQKIAMLEKARVMAWLEYLNPLKTFTLLRRETREARETFGNAAWEIIRENSVDPASRIVQAWEVPVVSLRLIRADRKPTKTTMRIRKDAISYEDITIERFFRRYVRITGIVRVYYKEFGDPRVVSRRTGHYFRDIDELRAEEGDEAQPAHELLHQVIKSQVSPYGTPRWIGTLLAVLGNRAAEEVNFLYFDNKAIPPMVLLVSGGRLAADSVGKIESYIQERIKGRENFHKIMVIEALPANAKETAGDIEPSGKLRIELKPLLDAQQKDGLFQEYDAANELKIGRAFRQPSIVTGDTKDMNRSCYSDDTETLTEHGWKLVDEIASDERIAAYDPKDDRIAFVIPQKKLVYEVENELLYRFRGRHTDVRVTHDHRMLFRPWRSSGETRKVWSTEKDARELSETRDFALRVAPGPGAWAGEPLDRETSRRDGKTFFHLPKVESCQIERAHGHHDGDAIPIEDWLEFLGYWISEGSLLQTNDPMSPYIVTLSQKKPAIRAKIEALMERLPWGSSASEDKTGCVRWRLSNRCLRDWLLKNCGGKSGDKHVPDDYLRLEPRLLRILYDALMDGDGTRDSRKYAGTYRRALGNRAYYSKNIELVGQVQQIGLLLGFRGIVRRGHGVWRVLQSDSFETRMQNDRHVTLERYSGRVYCFSVPGYGYFVTRRRGKVAIQGNTGDVAKAIGEEQVFQPARDEFDAEMDRYFLPNQGVRFWRFKTNAPVQRIPNDLVTNAQKCLEAGAITPNEARALLSDAFSKDFPHRPESWAQIPPRLAQAAAREGGGADGTPTDDLRALDAPGDEETGFEEGAGVDEAPPVEGAPTDGQPGTEPQKPEEKRARAPSRRSRSIARGAIKALAGLREMVRDELEKEKDDFFDPRKWGRRGDDEDEDDR